MSVSGSITVTRMMGGEEIDVNVEITGKFRRYSSANPNESGEQVEDIQVVSPAGLKLTDDEYNRAIEELEEQL